MTSNDKQRDAFEAFYRKELPDADFTRPIWNVEWSIWQAAWQAALAQRPEPPPPFLDRAAAPSDGGCGPRSDSGSGLQAAYHRRRKS